MNRCQWECPGHTTLLARSAFGLLLSAMLYACGGGGSDSAIRQTPPPEPVSNIPSSSGVAKSSAPGRPAQTPPQPTEQVILRHIFRDALRGEPTDGVEDSPNARVQVRAFLELYLDVDRQSDNTYVIEPEDNGLAYFRVVNTKPNGAKRVHLFYGVPPGYYVTLDSTYIDVIDNQRATCPRIGVRIAGLQAESPARRLQINANLYTGPVLEGSRGYQPEVVVCPLSGSDTSLVLVVDELGQSARYGFGFYTDLSDGDIVDIDIEHDVRWVPWASDFAIDAGYRLAASSTQWPGPFSLYRSAGSLADVEGGVLPLFDALPVEHYRWFGGGSSDSHIREFGPAITGVNFDLNDVSFSDVSLDPISLTWQSVGQDQPEVMSGVVFDNRLTQTYAFLTQDPDVLSSQSLAIPLQDIELLTNSLLFGLTGSKGLSPDDPNVTANAASLAAILYAPGEALGPYNVDNRIAVNGSELLIAFIEWLEGNDFDTGGFDYTQ